MSQTRAKAVMRRDLAVQREEREKREKVEQERAAEAAQKMAAEKKAAAVPPPVPAAPVVKQEPQQQQKQQVDVEMTDAAPAAATNTSNPAPKAPSVAAHTHLPPRPPAIQTNAATSDASTQPAPATATTEDLFGRTPTTAGINNADFDSMFEDFANSNDNDNDNAGGDSDMAADTNDEFDFGLLPGLESYANSDNAARAITNKDASAAVPEVDFSVLDVQNKAKEDEQKKKQEEEEKKKKEEEEKKKREEEERKKKEEDEEQRQQQQQQQQQEQNQPQQDNQDLNDVFQGDSTFDDLFNYTDFDMGGTGGSTGGGDTTFDDDFFNI